MLSLPYFLLIRLDQEDVRYGAIALIMALTAAVAAPFGLALAVVLPRELEDTLVLLIGTYAIDHTSTEYLTRGLVHGLIFAVVFSAVVAAGSSIRLRQRGHVRFVPTSPAR